MPRWFDVTLTKVQQHTENTSSFFFAMDNKDVFEFCPGQFITFDLPIGEKRLDRWRSYSIANPPAKSHIFELVIVKVPFGKATTFLFNELKVGDKLVCKGPAGVFCLPKKLEGPTVMICTGTGIAPFRSMVQDLSSKEELNSPIHLIFGTRNANGILYKEEWDKLVEENSNFSFSVALSREEYDGYQGYVHDIYMQRYTEPQENIKFYLCGWQKMVDEARENILSLGFEKAQIIEELYG